MGKNYMKYIEYQFGLELGEPFTLVNSNGEKDKNGYILTKNGLEKSDKYNNGIYERTGGCDITLGNMLRGYYDIKKIPWKPEHGEAYYLPVIDCGTAYATDEYWAGNYDDEKRYEAGLVCKTEDEATELAKQLLEAVRRRYDDKE